MANIDGTSGNDSLDGTAGADTIDGGGGNDTLNGGASNDAIYGDNNNLAPQAADTTNTAISNNFQVISLGTAGDIDPIEADGASGVSENGGLLNGQVYGSTGDPLSGNVVDLIAGGGNGDGQYDGDQNVSSDTFFINGTEYTYDGSAVYNNTLITFEDGSTALVSAVVFQDTAGNLYLAPESSNNGDTAIYTSQPITSIQLGTQDTSGSVFNGLTAARVADSWVENSEVVIGPAGDDSIDGGDGNDTIYGEGGNDSISGGTGDDTIYGDSTESEVIGDDFTAGGWTGSATLDSNQATFNADGQWTNAVRTTPTGMSSGSGAGGGAQLTLDFFWSNGAPTGSGSADFYIDYDGVNYVQITTAADGSFATIAYNNGATGPAGPIAVDAFTTLTFDLPPGIADSGELEFWADTTGGVTDDFAIDNVIVTRDGHITAPGNDTIDGGTGADVIDGGEGDDSLIGGDGNDSLIGGAGSDTLLGGDDNDTLEGGDGDDFLRPGPGSDSVFGGLGNDTLELSNNDTLDGGDGTDVLDATFGAFGETITFNADGSGNTGANNSIFQNIEVFQSDGGADSYDASASTVGLTISTGADSDTIVGGTGDDVFIGGTGGDSLTGGEGADTIFGDGEQTFYYSTDIGELYTYSPETGTSTLLQSGLQDYGDITVGADGTIYGVIFNAASASDAGIYSIDPDTGTETLVFDFPENAELYSSMATDPDGNIYLARDNSGEVYRYTPDGGGGFTESGPHGTVDINTVDLVFVDASTAWAVESGVIYQYDVDGSGNFSNETNLGSINGQTDFYGLTLGSDGRVYAYEGSGEVVSTDPFTLPLSWQAEPDVSLAPGVQLWGTATAPIESGADGNDVIDGGGGDDVLIGAGGDDSLSGGSGNDTLSGGTGNDTLRGEDGTDSLIGGDGDDVLFESFGTSTLDGGEGSDRFEVGFGSSTISGGDTGSNVDTLSAVESGDPISVTFGGTGFGTYDDLSDSDSGTFTGIEAVEGSSGADSIDGSADSGGLQLSANAGDDTIIGGYGNDALDGGTGNDSLTGGAGNDTLLGGAGADTIFSGTRNIPGNYSEQTGASDSFTGTNGNSDFTGTTTSNEGELSTFSNAGLNGYWVGNGDGVETHTHTFSQDVAGVRLDFNAINSGEYLSFEIDGIPVDLNMLIANGDAVFDGANAYGIDGSGRITETGPNDNATIGSITFLRPFSQIDVISSVDSAGSGIVYEMHVDTNPPVYSDDDSLSGGDDADTFIIQNAFGNDTIIGGEGGTDSDVIDLSGLSGPVTVTYTGNEAGTITDGIDTITFSEIERLILTEQADVVNGGADSVGLDIDGRGGDDTITGGSGNDTIDAGLGNDSIVAGDGADTLTMGDGADWVDAGTGNDTVDGGTGNDTIFGWTGDDSVVAGDGDDVVFGQDGNDTITGGAGNDSLDGDDATGGADSIDGGTGNDTLIGDAGNDTLVGGADDDVIFAGADDDLITGGTGNDSLTGGGGNDTFFYNVGDGIDTITDFNTGNSGAIGDGDTTNNDFIDLSTFYDSMGELRDDFEDDGILNQSNAITNGGTVDYSNNDQFASGEGIAFQGASRNSFTADNTGVVCFAAGTLILTERGEVPVERLRVDDRIVTYDNGLQPLAMLASRRLGLEELSRNPSLKPIEIKQGALGGEQRLVVSPQHMMMVLNEGEETLVRARQLSRLKGGAVRVMKGCRQVTYFHLIFDAHQIVFANGRPAESFFPGPRAFAALDIDAQREFQTLFPELDVAHLGSKKRMGWDTARALAEMRMLPQSIEGLRSPNIHSVSS